MSAIAHQDVRDVSEVLIREDDKHPNDLSYDERIRYERLARAAIEWVLDHFDIYDTTARL